jgi:hypothetical protein
MESWSHEDVEGAEIIIFSRTGYTNDQTAVQWPEDFVKHSRYQSSVGRDICHER